MSEKVQSIIESIKGLSLLEASELVKGLETTFGVSAAAASVAVAAPGPGIPVGLQPRLLPGGQNVNTGGNTSDVQVNTCEQVAVFQQPSVAVYVLVCERRQP